AWSRHKLQLFLMGSNDLLEVIASPSTSAPFEVNVNSGFQRLLGAWTWRGPDVTVRTAAFVGLDQASTGVGTLKVDSPARSLGLREDIELALHPAVTLRVGLDSQLRKQDVRLTTSLPLNYRPFPGGEPERPLQDFTLNVDQLNVAEWQELELRLPWALKLLPSLRLDAFRANDRFQGALGPRVTVRRDLGAGAVKAAVGMYSELPLPQDSAPLFGNPGLRLQRAIHSSAGFEHRFTDALNVDVTGFWSHRYDLAAPSTATADNGAPLRVESTGLGNAYGLEVFLRHELSRHFFGWLAYTLSRSQQRNDPTRAWRDTTFDQRHILTAIAQVRFGNGWEVGGRFRLVTGGPTTPITGSTFSADRQAYAAVRGAASSERLPAFHQLDVRVDRIWLFDTWQIGAYLDVQNVYNRQNANFLRYDYRWRGSTTVPDVPILPTLGVKGVF
ncbi:MAG TPA: TonB-dependent receptor, partial [Myxococcota bacterium]|nr:TonB-dependent receptor [Myxococcota bacterium]